MSWQPEIRAALNNVLNSGAETKIAVFDADGTIWHDDLGEAFFKYQVQNHLAPGVHNLKDPWQHYRNLCAKDHNLAYGWLAQINSSLPEATLRSQAQDYYRRTFRQKVNPDVRDLMGELTLKGFEVWICSASIHWAIEPSMADLGLNPAHLLAVRTKVDEKSIITSELITPLTYRAGKKFQLEKNLKATPLLVVGNSMGDLEMLEMAKTLSLVINFLPHLPEIKESEEALLSEARKRKWSVQIFK